MDLLLDILPFIAFVLVKRRIGLKEGVIVSVVLAVPAVVYHWVHEGKLGPVVVLVFISLGLLALLGWLSYVKQDEVIFKLQPAIAGSIFGIILLVAFYVFDYWVFGIYRGEAQG